MFVFTNAAFCFLPELSVPLQSLCVFISFGYLLLSLFNFVLHYFLMLFPHAMHHRQEEVRLRRTNFGDK